MAVTDGNARELDGGSGPFITALGVAQICSWGSLYYSFALVAEAMRVELGWTKTEIYGAATLGLVLAGVVAFPVGTAIDRGYGRYVMSMASLAAGILLSAWSLVSQVFAFYIVFAAIGCLQAATLYEPAFAVIARRFGAKNARRGITALTLWGGFASTVFIPLIQFLIDELGWRGALQVLGSINVICGALYYFAIDPSKDYSVRVYQPPQDLSLIGRKAVASAFRLPVFWTLVLALVGYQVTFAILTFHFYPLLLERGLGTKEVVTVLAVIGPAQVAGRVLLMVFAPNASIRKIGSLVVIAFPLAVLGLALASPNLVILTGIAAFYGAANGMMTIIRGLIVPEMISRDAYGAINGALAAPMNLVLAFSPLLAAWLWSSTGNYDAILVAIGGGSSLLCLGFWRAVALSRSRAN